MPLKPYQIEILPDTLYAISKLGGVSGDGAQIKPNIEIIGAAADVYVSNNDIVTPPTGMYIIENGTALQGGAFFEYIPNFLYVDGSPTKIILSGVAVVVVA